ncbi:MAG: hypothetical protein ABI548_25235 [Polyangiaceae bacterium]
MSPEQIRENDLKVLRAELQQAAREFEERLERLEAESERVMEERENG